MPQDWPTHIADRTALKLLLWTLRKVHLFIIITIYSSRHPQSPLCGQILLAPVYSTNKQTSPAASGLVCEFCTVPRANCRRVQPNLYLGITSVSQSCQNFITSVLHDFFISDVILYIQRDFVHPTRFCTSNAILYIQRDSISGRSKFIDWRLVFGKDTRNYEAILSDPVHGMYSTLLSRICCVPSRYPKT